MSSRDKLRENLLEQQGGKCAVCLRGPWCSTCRVEVSIDDIEEIGKGKFKFFHKNHPEHHVQMINTLDHHHSHKECKGCEKCVRGMTHDLCNRAFLAVVEINNHLQSEYLKEYLVRGIQK
jgi:hypothetical protein